MDAGEVDGLSEKAWSCGTDGHTSSSGTVSEGSIWSLRALQDAVSICCLRISIGKNTAIAQWTAKVLTHSGLVVAKSSIEVDTVRAALHAGACGKVRKVKIWRVGAEWHTETRSRISKGAH